MKCNDSGVYENWKNNNLDFYGKEIFAYSERWANLMEKAIENGEQLEDVAEKFSKEANTSGITGFMYGMAAQILSTCWECGEQFNTWHNNKYGYHGKGTVNPAIINVNIKEEEL